MSDRRAKKARQAGARGLTLTRNQRNAIEDQVERLIAILDAVEPDPDLEDNGDLEPSLGAYHGQHVDAELDESDREPSLGSLDRAEDQTRWAECEALGAADDRELDRSDYEPSLGSPCAGIGDQRLWSEGDRLNRECEDEDDHGDEHDEDRDGEPSLGAPERGEDANQVGWAQGGHLDLENDGLAPNALKAYLRKAAAHRARKLEGVQS